MSSPAAFAWPCLSPPGRLQPPATCSASRRLGALGGGPGPCGARAQSGLRGGDGEAGRRSSDGLGAQHRAQAAGGGAGRGPLPFFVTFNPLPGRKQFKLGDAFRAREPPSRAGEDRKLQVRQSRVSILSAWLRCKAGRRCSVAEINWLLPREVEDAWTPWYFLLRPLFTLKFLGDPLV